MALVDTLTQMEAHIADTGGVAGVVDTASIRLQAVRITLVNGATTSETGLADGKRWMAPHISGSG